MRGNLERISGRGNPSRYRASLGLRDFELVVEQKSGRFMPPMEVTVYPRVLNETGTAIVTDTKRRARFTFKTFTHAGAARKALRANPTPSHY